MSGAAVEQLLAAKEIVVVCGAGGVGKTTTAAALATVAADLGAKVLVLTVDPARRLAAAMGLEALGNAETRVSGTAFAEAGLEPRGELWAAMLDTKQSWDELVRRHAPDAATRNAILANPLYRNVTGKFVHSHDYIAMERLYELHSSGAYDLIVVDTPPSGHAIDFLEAPERMADFFSSRLLRWLLVPYRSRLVNAASRPFYQIADRALGSAFLADVAEFFILFQSMYEGFVARARAVEQVLGDRRTSFVVVTTLEAAPVNEAGRFVDVLAAKRLHLGAVVLNRVLPATLLDTDATEAARLLRTRSDQVATDLVATLVGPPGDAPPGDVAPGDDPLGPAPLVAAVLRELGESFLNFSVVASREAELRAELSVDPALVVTVPALETDVYDLAGLARVGHELRR